MDSDEGPGLVTLPDGRRTQVWRGGAPAGPAVFFFHGCPDSRLAARSGAAAARRVGVRLVAVNRPGYGLADPDRSRHRWGHSPVADDTLAVADLLGIERFAVLGMSVGGPYALACAARHADRVTAAALVASPGLAPEMDPPLHRDDLSPAQQEFFARLAAGSVQEAVELVRPEFEEYVARMAPYDDDDIALAGRLTAGLHPLDARLMAAQSPAEVAAQVRESLASTAGYLRDAAITFRAWDFGPERVSCPTSLWYGELDANAPARNGRWLAERIPGATLVVRDRTAHLGTLLEHWDELLRTLGSVP